MGLTHGGGAQSATRQRAIPSKSQVHCSHSEGCEGGETKVDQWAMAIYNHSSMCTTALEEFILKLCLSCVILCNVHILTDWPKTYFEGYFCTVTLSYCKVLENAFWASPPLLFLHSLTTMTLLVLCEQFTITAVT